MLKKTIIAVAIAAGLSALSTFIFKTVSNND